MNNLNNLVLQAIDNCKKEQNIKQYQFEKNKLYAYLGDLVNSLKKHKVFVAGGMITSLFTNSKINDIDLYFRDEKSAIAFIEEHWGNDIYVTCLTKKAVLFVKGKEPDMLKIQMVHFKYFNSPEEIFNTFDFTVCMGAFDFADEQFYFHEDFMKHNSQRILKFNPNTVFPLISLLRVHKYNNKGYTISKSEMIRILLKCMSLNIDSIDKLKEHLGGMYGINYDKIINLEDGEIFSLELVIDKIAKISHSEEFFNEPTSLNIKDIEDIVEVIQKKPIKYFVLNDKICRISSNDKLSFIGYTPTYAEKVNVDDYFRDKRFYKWVKKIDEGKYVSHYDNSFEYQDGKISTAKNYSLYVVEKNNIKVAVYSNKGVLIEVQIEPKDIQSISLYNIKAKSLKVIREVPKEEYEKWIEYKK